MIDELIKLIKEENIDRFKELFSKSTINATHRKLLYELSYRQQNFSICDLVEKRTNITKNDKLEFLLKTFSDGMRIKNFNSIKIFSDIELSNVCSTKKIIPIMVEKQTEDFLNNFLKEYPITVFLNFKYFISNGLKYKKFDFLYNLTANKLDKEMVFYIGLCSLNFKTESFFTKIIIDVTKYNKEIKDELKVLKNEYVKKLNRTSHIDKEVIKEFEFFIDTKIIEAFTILLDESLEKKIETNVKKKINKI